MNEEDYIDLQNLLIKLRVSLLKELDSKTLPIKQRDKDYRMLRSVDNLRKNVEVIPNEITIGIDMGSGKDKHI